MCVYSNYIEIDTKYSPVVSESAAKTDPDLWQKFVPHKTFLELLKRSVFVMSRERNNTMQNSNFFLHGAYGTGKTHAILTLQNLLQQPLDKVEGYFNKYDEFLHDYKDSFISFREKTNTLVVSAYGSSSIKDTDELVGFIQTKVSEALENKIGSEKAQSYKIDQRVAAYIQDNPGAKELFKHPWDEVLPDFSIDDFLTCVENGTITELDYQDICKKLVKICNKLNVNLSFKAVSDLKAWLQDIIKNEKLDFIFFIWDEFSEFLEDRRIGENKNRLTDFQEICEFCNEVPFSFLLVAHQEKSETMGAKIKDRFNTSIELKATPNIIYEVLGSALHCKDKEQWDEIQSDLRDGCDETLDYLAKLEFGTNDITKAKGQLINLLPIHPYAAIALVQMCTLFASNNRSMYNFMKDTNENHPEYAENPEGIYYLSTYLNKYNDEDPLTRYLTIDMLWDFVVIENKDRSNLVAKKFIKFYTLHERDLETDEQKIILKSVLLLSILGELTNNMNEHLQATQTNLDYCFQGCNFDIQEQLEICKQKKLLLESQGKIRPIFSERNEQKLTEVKESLRRQPTSYLLSKESLNNNDEFIQDRIVSFIVANDSKRLAHFNLVEPIVSDADSFAHNKKECLKKIKAEELDNALPVIFCVARNKDEQDKFADILESFDWSDTDSSSFVLVDCTQATFSLYEDYIEARAQFDLLSKEDFSSAQSYAKEYREILARWCNQITSSELSIFVKESPNGINVPARPVDKYKDKMSEEFLTLLRQRKPFAPEVLFSKITATAFKAHHSDVACLFGLVYGLLPIDSEINIEEISSASEQFKKQLTSINGQKLKLGPLSCLQENPELEFLRTNPVVSLEKSSWQDLPADAALRQIKDKVNAFLQENLDDLRNDQLLRFLDKDVGLNLRNNAICCFFVSLLLREVLLENLNIVCGTQSNPLDIKNYCDYIRKGFDLYFNKNIKSTVSSLKRVSDVEKNFVRLLSQLFTLDETSSDVISIIRNVRAKISTEWEFPFFIMQYSPLLIKLQTPKEQMLRVLDILGNLVSKSGSDFSYNKEDLETFVHCAHDNASFMDDFTALCQEESMMHGMQRFIAESAGKEGSLLDLAKLANIEEQQVYVELRTNLKKNDQGKWLWDSSTVKECIAHQCLDYRFIISSNKIFSTFGLPLSSNVDKTLVQWESFCLTTFKVPSQLWEKYSRVEDFPVHKEAWIAFFHEVNCLASGNPDRLHKQEFLLAVEEMQDILCPEFIKDIEFKLVQQSLQPEFEGKMLGQEQQGQFITALFNESDKDKDNVDFFTKDADHFKLLVANELQTFTSVEKFNRLKEYWNNELHCSETPQEWSERNKMPIEWLFDKDTFIAENIDQLHHIFDLLNRDKSQNEATEDDLTFISHMTEGFTLKHEDVFKQHIKHPYLFDVVDVEEFKDMLVEKMGDVSAYKWPSSVTFEGKLDSVIEKIYSERVKSKLFRDIDNTDAEEVKRKLGEKLRDSEVGWALCFFLQK